ncbi:MAG: hypothetical protein WBJ36_06135, partial [Tenuifilum sp.]
IPNRAVKPASADGTASQRESRSPPPLRPAGLPRGAFLFWYRPKPNATPQPEHKKLFVRA